MMLSQTAASNSQQFTSTNSECLQDEIIAKYNIKAYLAREKAPDEVQNGLKAVFSAATRRDEPPAYSQAVHDLQESIQKLNCRIDALPTAPAGSYPEPQPPARQRSSSDIRATHWLSGRCKGILIKSGRLGQFSLARQLLYG